ncbi:hypothetical protein SAMN05444050_4241 [Afipia sp. GAS231]|nr:hypothetical protein SAMN05444050_4241 [Afipia sp. GAS231]
MPNPNRRPDFPCSFTTDAEQASGQCNLIQATSTIRPLNSAKQKRP